MPNGLFVQFNKVLELGIGNVVLVMIVSLILYLLFEYPFKRLFELSLIKFCSFEDSFLLAYLRRNMNKIKQVPTNADKEVTTVGAVTMKSTVLSSMMTKDNVVRDSFD